MNPLGMRTWKWLALSKIGRPSTPWLGRAGHWKSPTGEEPLKEDPVTRKRVYSSYCLTKTLYSLSRIPRSQNLERNVNLTLAARIPNFAWKITEKADFLWQGKIFSIFWVQNFAFWARNFNLSAEFPFPECRILGGLFRAPLQCF